jgi:DNA-binding NarL/FixJ family response regulator
MGVETVSPGMRTASILTILLADSDQMRREGLATILSSQPGFSMLGLAPDGEMALALAQTAKPDVVVMDLHLPKLYGTELARRIRLQSPATRIVVIGGTSDDAVVQDAMRAGSDGYVLRTGPAKHLIAAIHHVSDGGRYFSPQLTAGPADAVGLEPDPVESDHSEMPFADPTDALAERIEDIFRPLHDRLGETSARVADRAATLRADSNVKSSYQRPFRTSGRPAGEQGRGWRARFRRSMRADGDPHSGDLTARPTAENRRNSFLERIAALGHLISDEPASKRRQASEGHRFGTQSGTRFGDLLQGEEELSTNPGAALFGSDGFELPPVRTRHRPWGSGRIKPVKVAWAIVLGSFLSAIVGTILYHLIQSGLLEKVIGAV